MCVLRDSVPLWPREPCQAFLSMGFSQQENGGCYFLLQVIFPTQGSKPMSPALAGGFFTTEPSGNHKHVYKYENIHTHILGEGNGNPLQYSRLENPMDRGAWQVTVHGIARVGHDLVTKPPNQTYTYMYICICVHIHSSKNSLEYSRQLLNHYIQTK